MTRSALRRAVLVSLVLFSCSAALQFGGRIGTTFALFNGETTNAGSVFAGGWIGAPSTPSTSVSGNDVSLTWTPGTHGPVTGQQLVGVDNGNTSTCTGVTYSLISTLSATATTTTDTGRGSSANGHYYCYAVVSTSGTATAPSSWTAQTAAAAVRVGFYMTSITIGTSGGTINQNDTVAIAFNQQPNLPSVSRVCVFASSRTIIVGDTSSTCSSVNDSYTVGKLVSSTSLTNNNNYGASISRTGNTLTVRITANATTATTESGTPSWTFTPAAITSATGSAALCTASASNCLPSPSGKF